MNAKKQNRTPLIIDSLFFMMLLGWLFAPLFIVNTGFKIELIKIIANPGNLTSNVGAPYSWLFPISFLLYLTPIVFLYKIASIFMKGKFPEVFNPNHYITFMINFIFSGLPFLFILLVILKRNTYMSDLDFFSMMICILSVVYGIIQFINIIDNLRYLSPSHKSYIALSKSSAAMQQINLQPRLGRFGILHKLLMVFIITNLAIILSLSSLLLGQFKKTIVRSVIATGTVLAEQSAGFILGNMKNNAKEKNMLNIEVDTYFKRQAAKNLASNLAFVSMSWYRNDKSTDRSFIYLSTDNQLVGKELKKEYYAIDQVTNRYNRRTKNYDIIAPIFIGKKKLGYSIVQYQQDEIFKTYYQTQFRILIFAILIIYLAVILVYIIGTNIVFPILFLQMNTRKISSTLSNMIQGSEEIRASSLHYEDMIHTQDEIKTLSLEISKMVTVIKGIIPYISASTLRHSDREEKPSAIKDLAFVFTDIRGFTTLSEGKSPNEVVTILNYYLDLQTQIILANKGDVDKFVGDEVMAVFDGPNKEFNACKAALEIQKAMQREKEKHIANNEPAIDIGIGMNSGPAVFGSMGARERRDFTCIGDNVNIAARLEGANKEYKTKSLITESVYNQVRNSFVCREIDLMTVKGKKEPLKIYEILEEMAKVNKTAVKIKENFEKGLKLYREKKWDEALSIFNETVEKFKDGPSGVFYSRCVFFKKNPPPADWDMVFNMIAK
jgi:class 3 adenylate cyclase